MRLSSKYTDGSLKVIWSDYMFSRLVATKATKLKAADPPVICLLVG